MPPKVCSQEGCELEVHAQGLCRKHYDAVKDVLPVASGPGKRGRPKGRVESSELPKDWRDTKKTRAEVMERAHQRMWAILDSDEANQQEVLACIRVAASWEEKAGSDDEAYSGMLEAVQGGKAS